MAAAFYSKQLSLDDIKPTPFTILFALYNARLALTITGFANLDITQQCASLSSNLITSKAQRRTLITSLINSDDADFSLLRQRVCLRMRVKHILRRFHNESQHLRQSTDIAAWNAHEIVLSFIAHLIEASANDNSADKKNTAHAKIWEFVNHLRRYLDEQQIDGRHFLDVFCGQSDPNAKPTGIGLKMMKTICAAYDLKSGPFSKVKKQCNAWATNLIAQSKMQPHEVPDAQPPPQPQSQNHAQSAAAEAANMYSQQRELTEQDYADIEAGKYVAGAKMSEPKLHNKFVTDVSMYAQAKPQKAQPASNGSKWFWFNDVGGFKWVPYREKDMAKLDAAWRNGQSSCLIINGEYRVEFDRSDPAKPSGNQYNSRMASPGGRTVVCSKPGPGGMIHGIPVAKQPL